MEDSTMLQTAIQATNQVATPQRAIRQHIEDTNLVNAIRNGKLVQVSWNQLTPDEKRAAYRNMFLASGLY
jgi:hypothetical protein